jgi:hypothetical protein
MDLDQLFSDYGATLADGDPDRTAGFYGFPVTMLTDDFVGTLDSPAALRSALTQARDAYRQWGVAGVTHELLAADRVTEKITRARVRWRYISQDGTLLIEPTYEYLLRADGAGPRIHVVVAVDEQRQVAALVARQA